MQFVSQCNNFTRQKAGGWKPAPSIPKVIGQSCLMCVTRGTCLGSCCLGDKGRYFYQIIFFNFLHFYVLVLPKVNRKPADQEITFELKSATIPGLQASLVNGGRISNRKKSRHSRLVLCQKQC